MKSICKLLCAIIILLLQGCSPKTQNGNTSPNIILINADDLGYGDLGCYGASLVQTPNIDKLAAEGRIFTDAHTASAVCSPSRYGLITGRYPLRHNFWGPLPGPVAGLTIDTTFVTLGSLLKDAGYATACIGKWHLGFGEESPDWNGMLKPGPLELGFDYYYGIPVVNSGPPFVYVENHQVVGLDPDDPFVMKQESATQKWPAKSGYGQIGGAKRAHLLYEDEKVGTTLKNKALEWLQARDEDQAFFLYLATTNIHHPFTPAPQFKGTSGCGRYGDFIHELDWIVGEVLQCIEEMGFAENTLVIFTSDNGGMLNHGGQDAWTAGHRLNGDLLGVKFGAWEGGHRIPFIARWPGKIPASSISDHLISQVDLLATFASLTGQTLSEEQNPDGINQLPELLGETEEPLRDVLIISPNSPDHLLVRKGNWVYIPDRDEGGFQGKKIGDHNLGGAAVFALTGQVNSDFVNGTLLPDAPPKQLYNLEKDPAQSVNLFGQHPEVEQEMKQILEDYRSITGPEPKVGWINVETVKKRIRK